jgi:MFS family permease
MLMSLYRKLFPAPKQKPLFIFALMVLFIAVFDGIVSYITPIILTESGLTKTVMGLIISSSSIFGGVFDFLLCRLFTKVHFRRIFLLMFAICFIYPFILWKADNIFLFLVAMALWGLYFDLINFGNFDFVSRYRNNEHSSSFGIIRVFQNTGYVTAPLLAGLIISEKIDWSIYGLGLAVISVAFLFYIALLVLSRKKRLSYKNEHFEKKANLTREIYLWKKIGKMILPLLILTSMITLGESFFWTIGPLLSENISFVHFNGLFLTAFTLPPLLTGWFVGRFTVRIGKKRTAYLSFMAGSLILAAVYLTSNPYALILIIFLSSFFMSLAWPSINGAYADYISESPKVEKEIEAVEDFFTNIGFVIGPVTAGYLADTFGNIQTFAIFGISGAIIAFILMLFTPKKIKIKV